MLTNLLCRQFKLVTAISFDIPEAVELLPGVAAFGEAALLKDAVVNCVQLIAGSLVQVGEPKNDNDCPAIELVIGCPQGAPRAPIRLVLYADGWRLFLGTSKPPSHAPQSGLAIGPYLAACFGAGEVFKRLRGLKQGKGELIDEGRELFLSVWSANAASSWDELDPDPDLGQTEFPPLYFVGAGAVAQAAALALAGLPGASGHMTSVNGDSLDLSNDNRYSLATLGDAGGRKAEFLEKFFETRRFGHYSHDRLWQDYVTGQGRPPNRADLAALEARFAYRFILSCVDDNGARHAIQNLWPELIIGGSTHGLTAKAITYDMRGDQLCLKCYNPVIDRNEVVKKRLDEAGRMDASRRDEFFARFGIDPVKGNEHLRDPKCGQLSEDDLQRFAAGEPMMSVGFVSVAAGVLLAAQVLRLVLSGVGSLTTSGSILIANFYRPSLRYLKSLPEQGCDCQTRRATDWLSRWSDVCPQGRTAAQRPAIEDSPICIAAAAQNPADLIYEPPGTVPNPTRSVCGLP